MTTVAARGRVMAADTQEIVGESGVETKQLCSKLFVTSGVRDGVPQKAVIGGAGASAGIALFVETFSRMTACCALERQPYRDMLKDHDFVCLVLWQDGTLEAWYNSCIPLPVLEPYTAVGTGAKVALGALAAGAWVMDAVRAAGAVDLYSNDRVESIHLAADGAITRS